MSRACLCDWAGAPVRMMLRLLGKPLMLTRAQVLTTLYLWANGQLAMGAVGSRSLGEPAMVTNRDVTALVKMVHGSSEGYWEKVQGLLRAFFGTT